MNIVRKVITYIPVVINKVTRSLPDNAIINLKRFKVRYHMDDRCSDKICNSLKLPCNQLGQLIFVKRYHVL